MKKHMPSLALANAILLISTAPVYSLQLTAQKVSQFNGYIQAQFVKTRTDANVSQNHGGAGVGFLVFYKGNAVVRPTADFTMDVFPGGTKELEIINGHEMQTIGILHNCLLGVSLFTVKYFSASFVAGPTLILPRAEEGWARLRPSVKPSINIFFPGKQNLMVKAYYLKTFKREKYTLADFSAWGIGVGLKLF